ASRRVVRVLFSIRRRHTTLVSDWSSDVCSSDLPFTAMVYDVICFRAKYFLFIPWIYRILERKHIPSSTIAVKGRKLEAELILAQIGRASCREEGRSRGSQ